MSSPTALPTVHRYLLDTVANFTPILDAPGATTTGGAAPSQRDATAAWAQTGPAAAALALLRPWDEERDKALRFFKPADAALSLASSLLKHVAIARLAGVPWAATHVTQERTVDNGKPFFAPGGVSFNASHHGHAGVLAGCGRVDDGGGGEELLLLLLPPPKVGIDVVLVDVERGMQDLRRVHGRWAEWAGIFEEAFSPAEMDVIKAAMPSPGEGGGGGGGGGGSSSSGDSWATDPTRLERALRVFYTHWALKEAYIKMTSEAFMASWLRQLEFQNVNYPQPAMHADVHENRWLEGETIRDIEVYLRGQKVPDVQIEIQAIGKNYMIATAVDRPAKVTDLKLIDVHRDVVSLAE